MKKVIIALLAVVALTACGIEEQVKSDRGRGDAPRPKKSDIDGRPADTITEMPDGFGGVASKCAGDGWRAFVTTRAKGYGSALAVVADPDCEHVGTGPDAPYGD